MNTQINIIEDVDGNITSENELTSESFDVTTHNGWITVENPRSGGHRTFQIKTVTNEDSGLRGKRIVSLLTGPNRESFEDWTGFGFATKDGVKVWGRFKGGAHEKMARILENVEAGLEFGLKYHFTGRCRVCNRQLTNPASIRAGIGPICAEGGM